MFYSLTLWEINEQRPHVGVRSRERSFCSLQSCFCDLTTFWPTYCHWCWVPTQNTMSSLKVQIDPLFSQGHNFWHEWTLALIVSKLYSFGCKASLKCASEPSMCIKKAQTKLLFFGCRIWHLEPVLKPTQNWRHELKWVSSLFRHQQTPFQVHNAIKISSEK